MDFKGNKSLSDAIEFVDRHLEVSGQNIVYAYVPKLQMQVVEAEEYANALVDRFKSEIFRIFLKYQRITNL